LEAYLHSRLRRALCICTNGDFSSAGVVFCQSLHRIRHDVEDQLLELKSITAYFRWGLDRIEDDNDILRA
jgi:hypothetical protein